MAGHSKWANIQHRKGKQDAKRGKVFTKLIRAITVAARLGGDDLSANPRLRDAVDKAKSANMPIDTIARAIKKGAGGLEGQNVEEITYEGYGPSGVAVMVECMTDNRKRTVAEVRHAFAKAGGNLGTGGSVAYLFSKQGQLSFPSGTDEEQVMTVALDNGADDVITNDDGTIDVTTDADNFSILKQAMIDNQITPAYADISMVASTNVPLDKDASEKLMRMIDTMEDLDDTQNVYTNAEFPDEVIESGS